MSKYKDKIILPQMTFMGRHGVCQQEKEEKQTFIIDLELYLDLSAAAVEDDLNLTLDYGKIYVQVREIIENNSYNLLEHLAQQIMKLALSFPQVKKAKVWVEKPAARAGNAEFRAQILLEREKD